MIRWCVYFHTGYNKNGTATNEDEPEQGLKQGLNRIAYTGIFTWYDTQVHCRYD